MRRSIRLVPFLFLLALVPVRAQQSFPLDASAWVINPDTQSIAYAFDGETGTACFNFPRSPVPDPTDYLYGTWYTYVLTPWTSSIAGTQLSLTYKIKEARPDTTLFNFMSEPSNTCAPVGSPVYCSLYFTSLPLSKLYDGSGWNRWFSVGQIALGPGRVTLTVGLDPGSWIDTYGRSGTLNPSAFYATLNSPSFVGFGFGGGCFKMHGTNTTGGKAQFQLLDFSSF